MAPGHSVTEGAFEPSRFVPVNRYVSPGAYDAPDRCPWGCASEWKSGLIMVNLVDEMSVEGVTVRPIGLMIAPFRRGWAARAKPTR